MELWRRAVALAFLGLVVAGCGGGGGGNSDGPEGGSNQPQTVVQARGWELVWADEFDGSSLDTQNWNVQTGDGSAEGIPGWGNNELQSYEAANIEVNGGQLIITAREEMSQGRNYTSARINSANRFDLRYGRIEARIQAPAGQGLWSAFWMLPTDSVYGTWAASGEIDIMEVFSRSPAPFTQAAAHYGMSWPLQDLVYQAYDAIDPADGFHEYAVEWDENELRWFVDGVHFFTLSRNAYWTYYRDMDTNAYTSGGPSAPFDQDFHLLLNLAVGGNLPGAPEPASFPGQLLVDYVRVYECNIDPLTGAGCDGFEDLVDPSIVSPPADDVFIASYDLYTDALNPLTFDGVMETVPLNFGVFDNDGALAIAEMDAGGDHGIVIDVTSTGGGNFNIFAADSSRQNLFGMGAFDDGGTYAGEIQFDLYVFSAETDQAGAIQVKIGSGFPDLGFVELPVAELPQDEWTTVTVSITDIVRNPSPFGGGPVDLANVLSLAVIEPTSSAHFQIDNLRIKCGHPNQDGCGISPPAPPEGPTAEARNVFVDAVDATWDVGIAAADSDSGFANYTDGMNPANKVSWSVVTDGDRGEIIEVNFAESSAFGVWFIQASAGVDMSAYAGGTLNFDIRVDSYGANTQGMTMKVDCIYPCTSGDQLIGQVGNGDWETVSIPVAQLVGGGLNLSTVNTGLVIFPTDQSVALTFQLDNIVWLPPVDEPPAQASANVYDDGIDAEWFLWDCCGAATFGEVADDPDRGNVVELAFGPGGTVTGFQANTSVDVSSFVTLEFDAKEISPPPAGALWRLKLESSDAATAVELVLTDGENPTPNGEWQSYSYTLSGDLAGLDTSDLKLIMVFPDFGNADGATIRLDNVRFVAPPPAAPQINLFDDSVDAAWFLWDCCGGATFNVVADDTDHPNAVEFAFNAGGTVVGWQAATTVDASALADGVLQFDFKEVSPPPMGSLWRVKLESDGAATAVEILLTDGGNPSPSAVWQTYTYDLATLFAGLDLANLKLVMVFPDFGNADGAVARLDNVMLAP